MPHPEEDASPATQQGRGAGAPHCAVHRTRQRAARHPPVHPRRSAKMAARAAIRWWRRTTAWPRVAMRRHGRASGYDVCKPSSSGSTHAQALRRTDRGGGCGVPPREQLEQHYEVRVAMVARLASWMEGSELAARCAAHARKG